MGDHLSGGLWVLEFATGVSTRLGFDAANMSPVWSPNGKYVALFGPGGIYREAVNGAGKKQLLLKTDVLSFPKSWSPDGRYLIYAQVSPTTGSADLIALAVAGDQGQLVLAGTPANEGQGEFSPDGRWVAYTSNESGLSEIYVIPFPPTPNGGRWMVSHGGGVQPRWRRDDRELFYISPDGTMMAVPVSTGRFSRPAYRRPCSTRTWWIPASAPGP